MARKPKNQPTTNPTDIEEAAKEIQAAPALEMPPLADPATAAAAEAKYWEFAAPTIEAPAPIVAPKPDARDKAAAYLKALLVNTSIYIGGQLEAATILIDNGIVDDDVLKYLTELMEGNGREHADRRRAASLIFKLCEKRNRQEYGLAS